MPGVYVAKLTVNGQEYEQSFKVSDDPRLNIDIDVRREWNESLFEITSLYEQVIDEMKATQLAGWKVDELKKEGVSLDEKTLAPLDEINRKYNELFSRTRSLYFEVSSYIGPWTTDQHAQFNYYTSMISKLAAEREQVVKNTIPRLNRGLKKDQKITIE